MIAPTQADIGRAVVYHPWPDLPREEGIVTGFNAAWVFVRYGNSKIGSKATAPCDLEWVSSPTPAGIPGDLPGDAGEPA